MPAQACTRPHVIVVDDEEELCELISLRLEHHGYRVTTRQSGTAALRLLEQEPVDAMLLDLRLRDENGIEVLAEAHRRAFDLPVLILTAYGTIELAVEATRNGAHGFLTKPFDDRELLQKLASAVAHVRTRREAATSAPEFDGTAQLVGRSRKMAEVRGTIARIAASEATVLLQGESGTGKEVAARALHAASGRTGRFVAVNCGALPPELLESELFGHVRGAFTGALRDKEGLFAVARGGTMLLDEVGDAPLSVQVKLLRVLQERSYVPVGAVEPQRADVRVVAATHRDLRADVATGRFREDLFYRLHVLPITLPALRERREDIPLLAELFLNRAVARHGLAVANIHPATLELLCAHDWPGNVRELANVIEGAALLCNERSLCRQQVHAVLSPTVTTQAASDLTMVRTLPAQAAAPDAVIVRVLDDRGPLPPMREARMAFDRAYLTQVLLRAAGNVTAAARMAGRNRTDFYELLHRHALNPLHFRS